jgi:hypothetical protein
MQQEFIANRNVYLDRDPSGAVRQLRHIDAPVISQAHTPQLVASEYLHSYRDLLELPNTELASLGLAPSSQPEEVGVELRYLGQSQQFDTATVAYHQTVLGLPIFQAGLAVQMKTGPFQVICAQSTQHSKVHVDRPNDEALKRAESIQATQLARLLGVSLKESSAEQTGRKTLVI